MHVSTPKNHFTPYEFWVPRQWDHDTEMAIGRPQVGRYRAFKTTLNSERKRQDIEIKFTIRTSMGSLRGKLRVNTVIMNGTCLTRYNAIRDLSCTFTSFDKINAGKANITPYENPIKLRKNRGLYSDMIVYQLTRKLLNKGFLHTPVEGEPPPHTLRFLNEHTGETTHRLGLQKWPRLQF